MDELNKKFIIGVIESNRQIIRNESGKDKHKAYTGVYKPKPLKVAPIKPDYPVINSNIKKTQSHPENGTINNGSIILWSIFFVIVVVLGMYLFNFH